MATGGHSESLMSEETFDFICTGCDKMNKTVKAVKYCVDCKVYCCQTCTDMHEMFPPLAGHSFLEIGRGNQFDNQQYSLPEFPTERCCKHKGKVLDMYCEMHNEVGCYTCMAKNHKTCPEQQIFSVPDMLDKLCNISDSQQTQSRLQKMITSMTLLSESKEDGLRLLKESKDETIDEIVKYQNVLEIIIQKATELSIKEVEKAYEKVENDILQDKGTIDSIINLLEDTNCKLNKTATNRAQSFVCSKVAEKHIEEAEYEKTKQANYDNTDVKITFCTNSTLNDYIQGLQGIGDIVVAKKKKTDIYKLKGSRDISIKVANDAKTCYSEGCCLTQDNQLLVTDLVNKKVKRIDTSTMTVTDYCSLDSRPIGICCINQQEAVVACCDPNKIQYVSIEHKIMPTMKIDTPHGCYGIAMNNENLYVTDMYTSLYVYDMNGTLLRTITNNNDGNKLFSMIRHIAFNESGNKMFVGDLKKGIVCFDGKGNYLSTERFKDVDGICSDGRGNIFVGSYTMESIIQFDEDAKKIGVVGKPRNRLHVRGLRSISFHYGQNRMFVTMHNSDIMKMFELE